jgi:N-acetylmuramoyl-L-alanine amidase
MSSKLFFFSLLFLSTNSLFGQFTVYIDPGHGGNNKGAVAGEIEEKDLTLELALKLKAFFKKHPDPQIKVIFSRTSDEDLMIKKRVKEIEKIKPDLFISLHFNSQKFLATTRGFEIYYPADTLDKASGEMAKKYDRANRSFYYGKMFKDLYFKANIHTTWKLPFNLFTQKYGIKLFDETTVPGLLLEIAYLTSPDDRACVENKDFMADIAWYIYDAIKKISKKKLKKK